MICRSRSCHRGRCHCWNGRRCRILRWCSCNYNWRWSYCCWCRCCRCRHRLRQSLRNWLNWKQRCGRSRRFPTLSRTYSRPASFVPTCISAFIFVILVIHVYLNGRTRCRHIQRIVIGVICIHPEPYWSVSTSFVELRDHASITRRC